MLKKYLLASVSLNPSAYLVLLDEFPREIKLEKLSWLELFDQITITEKLRDALKALRQHPN